MTDDSDNVRRLPVRHKRPPGADAPILEVVDNFGLGPECDHRWTWRDGSMAHVTYSVRPGHTEVECGECRTKLDPMWVLIQLAGKESEWARRRAAAAEEFKRLRERKRTKCDNCGAMTRISGR